MLTLSQLIMCCAYILSVYMAFVFYGIWMALFTAIPGIGQIVFFFAAGLRGSFLNLFTLCVAAAAVCYLISVALVSACDPERRKPK